MAKIVKFKTSQDDLVEALEYILERAREGEIRSFAFAAKCTDGNIATSYGNADVGTKNELLGHIQADIMYDIMKANIDQLIEYV